jgi:type IX secretion system PorP/SprF family membrane protein
MKFIALAFLICVSLFANDQSVYNYTMFENNYSVFNPAVSGMELKQHFALQTRSRFVTGASSPVGVTALYDQHLGENNAGIGINYSFLQANAEKVNRLNLNLAIGLSLGKGTLSLGAGGGLCHVVNNASSGAQVSQMKGILNAGLYFNSESIFLGVSSFQLNEPEYPQLGRTAPRIFSMTGGIKLNLSEGLEFRPSILYMNAHNGGDFFQINALFEKKNIWFGGGYRNGDKVLIGMIGTDVKERIRIGYSLDFSTTGLQGTAWHELLLSMRLAKD